MDNLDQRDRDILAKRNAQLDLNQINVGDFVIYADGSVERISYIWRFGNGPEIVQTSYNGSFYLAGGYVSFSGGLNPGVPYASLTLTTERRDGSVWFFHHDFHTAHNGVNAFAPFRVWKTDQMPV